MLGNGFHDIPSGKVATIVTYLEMRTSPASVPRPMPEGVELRRVMQPDTAWYRDLYFRVGGFDWLWFSRLQMTDAQLQAILDDQNVHVFAVEKDGVAEGLLELDFRDQGSCELAFLGLTKALIGKGVGGALMSFALDTAWRAPIDLLHIHTCTLDSPQALGFYRKCGFKPVRQQVEIVDDPRLNGVLPRDAGKHIPIIEA